MNKNTKNVLILAIIFAIIDENQQTLDNNIIQRSRFVWYSCHSLLPSESSKWIVLSSNSELISESEYKTISSNTVFISVIMCSKTPNTPVDDYIKTGVPFIKSHMSHENYTDVCGLYCDVKRSKNRMTKKNINDWIRKGLIINSDKLSDIIIDYDVNRTKKINYDTVQLTVGRYIDKTTNKDTPGDSGGDNNGFDYAKLAWGVVPGVLAFFVACLTKIIKQRRINKRLEDEYYDDYETYRDSNVSINSFDDYGFNNASPNLFSSRTMPVYYNTGSDVTDDEECENDVRSSTLTAFDPVHFL